VLKGTNLEECAKQCNEYGNGCLGIELFDDSKTGLFTYKKGDCILSSGINTNGCDTNAHNVFLWEKKKEGPCD
jgi:hypothetical protein